MAQSLIRFDQVCKRYPGGQDALLDVSFTVSAGEMVFVTGHSGAGKSTLLKLLALMERPTQGTILLDGRNLARVSRHGIPPLRQGLGLVFQDHHLLPQRSVFANVELPLLVTGTPRRQRATLVRGALRQVGLAHCERRPTARLSVGEQQRAGIARAIVTQPPLLLADEPTGNLDPQLASDIMELFATFRRNGTTVLVASHDLVMIKRMRQRVVVLDHGRLIDDVPAAEVA